MKLLSTPMPTCVQTKPRVRCPCLFAMGELTFMRLTAYSQTGTCSSCSALLLCLQPEHTAGRCGTKSLSADEVRANLDRSNGPSKLKRGGKPAHRNEELEVGALHIVLLEV